MSRWEVTDTPVLQILNTTATQCHGLLQAQASRSTSAALTKYTSSEIRSSPMKAHNSSLCIYSVGSVLCPPTAPVPLCTSVLAQVLVFQPTYPLVAGTSIEVFHHSANIPSTLSELVATVDKSTGAIKKKAPRVLSHGTSAQVRIALHAGGSAGQSAGCPIEQFSKNKEMARILLRRDGETVAAGIVLDTFAA